jgi:hypothetical protein
VAILAYAKTRRWRDRALFATYALAVFLIYHAVLNWQPRGLFRLGLPFVLLASPLVAVYHQRRWTRWLGVAVHLGNTLVVLGLTLFPLCLVLANKAPENRLLRALARPHEQPYGILVADAAGASFRKTISTPTTLRAVYAEAVARIPAGARIGFVGEGEDYYLFGRGLRNRVTPLWDALHPDLLVDSVAPLDYIVLCAPLIPFDKARGLVAARYPGARPFLAVEKAEDRRSLLEAYRLSRPPESP